MKNNNTKYYLVNNHYALITNLSLQDLKIALKQDFKIDIYVIKKITYEEYCSWINENDKTKTTTKYY